MIYHATREGKLKARELIEDFKDEFNASMQVVLDGSIFIVSKEGHGEPKKAEKMAYKFADKVKKFIVSKGMKITKFDVHLEYEAYGYWPAVDIIVDPSYFGTEVEKD